MNILILIASLGMTMLTFANKNTCTEEIERLKYQNQAAEEFIVQKYTKFKDVQKDKTTRSNSDVEYFKTLDGLYNIVTGFHLMY